MDNQTRPTPPAGFSYGEEPAATADTPALKRPSASTAPAPPPGFSYDKPAAQDQATLKRPGYGLLDVPKAIVGGVVRGVGSLVKGAGELVDRAPTAMDPGLAIAEQAGVQRDTDAPKFLRRPGTTLGDAIGTPIQHAGDWIKNTQSDAAKEVQQKNLVEGELLHPSTWRLGEGAASPMNWALKGGDMLGQMAPMLVGAEAAGANALSRVAGMTPEIAAAIRAGKVAELAPEAQAIAARAAGEASRATVAAGAGAGGLQGAEDAGGGEADRIAQMPDEDLAKLPAFKQMTDRGMTPEAARAALAEQVRERVFSATLPMATAAGGVSTLPLLHNAQGVLSRAVGQSAFRRAVAGAALEAPTQGALAVGQTATSVAGANAATGEDRDPMADSLATFGAGAFPGAVFGAAGGFHRPGVQPERAKERQATGPMLALPAPVFTANDRGVVRNTADQSRDMALASARADYGITPDIERTQAERWAAQPKTRYPEAAPGSLSDAANSLPASGDAALDQAGDASAARVRQADPVMPTWVDPSSGEVGQVTPDALANSVAEQMISQHAIDGTMRINSPRLAEAWGVSVDQVKRARTAAQRVASDRIAATERAALNSGQAAEPSTSPAAGGSQPDHGTVASIPVMITQAMKRDLRARGLGDGDIAKLTPQEAHDVLAQPTEQPAASATDESGVQATAESSAPSTTEQETNNADVRRTVDELEPEAPVEAQGGAPAASEGQAHPAVEERVPGEPERPVQEEGRPAADSAASSPEQPIAEPEVAASTDSALEPAVSTKAEQAAPDVQGQQPAQAKSAAQAAPGAAGDIKHRVSGAAWDAEGLRVETPQGPMDGRSHVDQLVRDGYTRVESIPAGKQMVHRMVNAAGEMQPIKARQLRYAQERVERATKVQAEAVPVDHTPAAKVEAAAAEAASSPHNDLPEPTDAQKEAGNYKKGHVTLHGLDISIENPRGSTRSGTSPDGTTWSHEMSDHYGYIKRTEGADGDHVDVYVGPKPEAKRVFVVDQVEQGNGKFDEHKAMLGFTNKRDAVAAYRKNFDPGWKVGPVRDFTIDQFKTWLKEGDTTRPAAEHDQQLAKSPSAPGNKVVDEVGKPLTVYHGTREPFTGKFDQARSKDAGVWFTPMKGASRAYGEHVIPAHVRLENPYEAKVGESRFRSLEKAMDGGHDGVIVRDELGKISTLSVFNSDAIHRLDEGQVSARKRKGTAMKDMGDAPFLAPLREHGNATSSIVESVAKAKEHPAFKRLFDAVGALEKERVTEANLPKLQEVVDGLSKGFGISRVKLALHDTQHPQYGKMLGAYEPKTHVVTLNHESLRSHEAVSVLFHEYGHHMVRQLLGENLEHSPRGDAMYRAYMAWKRDIAPDATVREARGSRSAFFRNLYGDRVNGGEDRSVPLRDAKESSRAYSLDADEFFADMISRALYDHEGAQRLLGSAGGVFAKIAHAMKMVFDLVRRYDSRLTDTPQAFRDFIKETWNRYGGADELGTASEKPSAGAKEAMFSRDGWDENFPDVALAHPLNAARDHEDYAAAKGGDREAALRLARDLVTPEFVDRVREALPEGSKPYIVPVVARESAGHNRIPDAAAHMLARELGAKVDRTFVQAEKVGRGGADAMHRLANQPTFEGKVEPGRQYVLLDDTLTQGGTLAQLKTHIEREGGEVVLATALTGKEYSRKLALEPQSLEKVRERFGRIEGWWRREFGHGFDGLTESEARTILKYDGGKLSPDALRDRILARRIPGLRRMGGRAAGDRSGAEAPGAARGQEKPDVKPDLDDSGQATAPGEGARPFSRSAQSIEALQEGVPKAQQSVLDQAKAWVAGKVQDFKPAALGALQLRHVLELMHDSKQFPAARSYADIYQRMDGDRTRMINTAAEKTDRWQKWAYQKGLPGMLGKLKPEATTLSRFIHDVTQLGIDPTDGYKRLLMEDSRGSFQPWTKELIKDRIDAIKGQMRGRPGDDKTAMLQEIKDLRALPKREKAREARYPQLAARWQALSADAKDMFHMAREHYQQQSDAMERALLDRIEAMSVPETYKRSLADRIRFQFEGSRVEGVYFPLSRFGDYWVSGVHANGEHVFSMFESFREAEKAEAKLKAAGFEIEAHGKKDSDYRAKDAPSGTFVSDVIGILRKSGAPEKVQDEIYQTFLKTLPEMSMRKHGIHRKNVAGFNDDALRAFAKNGFHSAHQVARLQHGFQMQAALDAMTEGFENRRGAGVLGGQTEMSLKDATSGDALLGELRRRHDWIMSPKDSQLANAAGAVGFLYYMSASPASALVNLTQGAQVTLPVLGARHGWRAATRELAGATRDAMRTGGNILRTLRSDEERQAYKVLEERGTFNRTATHTLAGIAEGNTLTSNPGWAKVMGVMGYLFHKAEVINRESAGVAAFRLARSEGRSFDQSVAYADEIVNGTHFDFSNANRARYMQGQVAKVLTQFKSYSLGMSWVLYRNLYKAVKGETPEVRKLARRTLTGVMGMTGLIAGAMGLPIINLVRYGADAVHAVTGDDDEPWDFNTEFRSWLAEHLGDTAADWVADGAVNQITGANVAGRTSMSDMWFRDPDRELEGKDAYYNLLDTLAGPMGGMTKNFFIGSQMVSQGQTWRGIETMLPKFAKDGMKAVRYAKEGANTLRGDPIVPDVSSPEVLLQALGFSSANLAKQQRVNSALMNYQQFIQNRRQALMNAFSMAQLAGDDDGRSDALGKIRDFNAKYPEIAIGMANLHDSLRARVQHSAQADNGIMLNRKLAGRVRQEVGAMGGE